MSRVQGAPWDFTGHARDDNDGGITERVDARPPHSPIEIPFRINVSRVDVEKFGPTKRCPGCQKVTRGTVPSQPHSDGAVSAWRGSRCKIPSGQTG